MTAHVNSYNDDSYPNILIFLWQLAYITSYTDDS